MSYCHGKASIRPSVNISRKLLLLPQCCQLISVLSILSESLSNGHTTSTQIVLVTSDKLAIDQSPDELQAHWAYLSRSKKTVVGLITAS